MSFWRGAYEYLCSVFTELVFGVVFWDYSHIPFNLAGRVNLLYCFFWGIAAVVWVRWCYPKLSGLIERIPRKWGRPLTWVLVVFFVLDITVSALALGRLEDRSQGLPPQNAVEEYLDEHYGDQRMNRIYPAAVGTDSTNGGGRWRPSAFCYRSDRRSRSRPVRSPTAAGTTQPRP